MNAVETAQRARGWRQCSISVGEWHSPDSLECGQWRDLCVSPWDEFDDPLADTPEGWWEFGQILEWAEEWADGIERRIQVTRTWEWDGQTNARQWLALVMKGPEIVSRAQHPDFRAAFIEALAEAVGGTG